MNTPSAKIVVLLLAFGIFGSTSTGAMAENNPGNEVSQVLIDRTEGFCRSVLPAWFAAENGMGDENVQTLVSDCYTGQARLALLGVKKPSFPLEETRLSEVPAMLLRERFGMNLDVYAPLAGRTLQIK